MMVYHGGKAFLLNKVAQFNELSSHLSKQSFSSQCYPNITRFSKKSKHLLSAGITEKRYFQTYKKVNLADRSHLKYAKRLVVKLGSNVIMREDEFGIALGRLASIIEQMAECQIEGRECILVTSGAVACGKQKLNERFYSASSSKNLTPPEIRRKEVAAAVGQSSLTSLYETFFAQYGVKVAQFLVAESDFNNEQISRNIFSSLSELMSRRVVPIINTNDAITFLSNPEDKAPKIQKIISIKDNDSLAAFVAVGAKADLLILMSDVDGIYTAPPSQIGAKFLSTFNSKMQSEICFGEKSSKGTGGMHSKVSSALYAVENGVSVIICNGKHERAVKNILAGKTVGTIFIKDVTSETRPNQTVC